MKWLVYLHYRLDTGDCFYIGKGTEKRAHERHGRNRYWKRINAKVDRKVVIAQYFDSEQDALAYEVALIARFNPVANITAGGEGTSGLRHTDATKLKCREATLLLRENKEWLDNNLGKMREAVATPESRQKISIARKEFFNVEANRIHMSIKQAEFIKNNPELDRKRQELSYLARQTEEYKLLSSKVQGGKDFLAYKDSKFVAEVQIMNEFARQNDLHSAAIHRCLKGKQKAHKGYTFKYKEVA